MLIIFPYKEMGRSTLTKDSLLDSGETLLARHQRILGGLYRLGKVHYRSCEAGGNDFLTICSAPKENGRLIIWGDVIYPEDLTIKRPSKTTIFVRNNPVPRELSVNSEGRNLGHITYGNANTYAKMCYLDADDLGAIKYYSQSRKYQRAFFYELFNIYERDRLVVKLPYNIRDINKTKDLNVLNTEFAVSRNGPKKSSNSTCKV